ncbi:MAG: type II toxin-antitoxin system RelB/DinJ family antitoxin [Patescibacteria group bacterium]
MKTTVINIKTKPIVKIRAQQIADELGFGLSSLINGFLNNLIKTKTIHFSAVAQDEPSEYLLQALQEAENGLKKGKIISFKDPNDAVAYVGSLIKKK